MAVFGNVGLERKVIVLKGLLLRIEFRFIELKPSEPKLFVFFLDVNVVLNLGRTFGLYLLKSSYFEDQSNDNYKMANIVAHDELFPKLFNDICSLSLGVGFIIAFYHFKFLQAFQKLNILDFVFQKRILLLNSGYSKQNLRNSADEFVVKVFMRLII